MPGILACASSLRTRRGALGIRRREVLMWLGGSLAWMRAASAQQSSTPVVGYLGPESPGPFASRVKAFREGLAEAGYVEGRNVAIEFRWAEGRYDRLPALAADLVDRRVDIMIAPGGAPVALAAKAATATIPIVFEMGEILSPLGSSAACRNLAATSRAYRA